MHALMEEEVAAVVGVGLVVEPEAVAIAVAVGEIGDRAVGGEQARGTERLAVRHQAAERPPTVGRSRIDVEVIAPAGECPGKDAGEVVDAVPLARRAVGGEHESIATHHPQARPACGGLETVDIDDIRTLAEGRRRCPPEWSA